ncbi:MAG: hypothetical protein QOD08_842, partial [Gaiellaceae bacterium]|nr:hypothetical protein [Gaiellaceae bacterium]
DAEDFYKRSLSEFRALGHDPGVADRQNTIISLADFVNTKAAAGELDPAGVLWGAIEAEERRGPVGVWEQQKHEIADVLPPLPPDALRRGRTLTLDEAVTYALESAG